MNIPRCFPFRLVTFDATNTILKFTANIGKTYSDIGEKHGVKCDANELTESFKHQFKKMSSENPHFGCTDGISWQNWWRSVVFQTFKNCQGDIMDSKLAKISEELIEVYKTDLCWKPASGAVELLNYLKARGVTLGVISNSDPRLHDILKIVHLNSYFNFVVTSYEVGYSKPDKRIFDRAMKESELKDLKNIQCLHIGDDLQYDYKGARSVDWHSFLITKKLPRNLMDDEYISSDSSELKDKVFGNLKSLKEYMESEFNEYDVLKEAI